MTSKHLALAASMIPFTAIAGQASARPEHSGRQHSTNSMTYSSRIQNQEFLPGGKLHPTQSRAWCTVTRADRTRTTE